LDSEGGVPKDRIQTSCVALFSSCLPASTFSTILTLILVEIGARLLEIESIIRASSIYLPANDNELRTSLRSLLRGLHDVGLAGGFAVGSATRALDELLRHVLNENVGEPNKLPLGRSKAGVEYYIRNTFAPVVKEILLPLGLIDSETETDGESSQGVPPQPPSGLYSSLVQVWIKRGHFIIARKMATQLYDLVVNGAVADNILANDLEV